MHDTAGNIDMKTDNISLKGLQAKKYKKNKESTKKQWIDVESERFINWMQTPLGNTFDILWGRIDTNIPKGKLKITIKPDLRNNADNVVKIFKMIKMDSSL